jgi:hypothetical protein
MSMRQLQLPHKNRKPGGELRTRYLFLVDIILFIKLDNCNYGELNWSVAVLKDMLVE